MLTEQFMIQLKRTKTCGKKIGHIEGKGSLVTEVGILSQLTLGISIAVYI